MCTVSYVFSHGQVIITSNRDEKVARPKAMIPKNYSGKSKNLFFPKDSKAGGTWYVIDDKGNVIVLLNGADEKHLPKDIYRKSRGLILLDIFDTPNCISTWEEIDLDEIEPFTLVVYFEKKLYQLRWNGEQKSKIQLDEKGKYIWSSTTLYPLEVRKEREILFQNFTDSNDLISADAMAHFHQYTKEEDSDYGLVINRNNTLITLSITQTLINQNKMVFTHNDLVESTTYQNNFLII